MQGQQYSIELEGVKDMPRPATRLELDFSSLLGPLFFMWLMQLLLPVNVYALVHEKECGLRMMMRLQGLSDRFVQASSSFLPICNQVLRIFEP